MSLSLHSQAHNARHTQTIPSNISGICATMKITQHNVRHKRCWRMHNRRDNSCLVLMKVVYSRTHTPHSLTGWQHCTRTRPTSTHTHSQTYTHMCTYTHHALSMQPPASSRHGQPAPLTFTHLARNTALNFCLPAHISSCNHFITQGAGVQIEQTTRYTRYNSLAMCHSAIGATCRLVEGTSTRKRGREHAPDQSAIPLRIREQIKRLHPQAHSHTLTYTHTQTHTTQSEQPSEHGHDSHRTTGPSGTTAARDQPPFLASVAGSTHRPSPDDGDEKMMTEGKDLRVVVELTHPTPFFQNQLVGKGWLARLTSISSCFFLAQGNNECRVFLCIGHHLLLSTWHELV